MNIFTRGATEGINLVASTYGEKNINSGDEILISSAEHHANLVCWQQLALKKGAKLRFFDLDNLPENIMPTQIGYIERFVEQQRKA